MTRGKIRDDLEPEQIADSLWTINDPANYQALVLDRGWSEPDCRQWLAHVMRSSVLDDPTYSG